jgi:hypothetical protein
VKFEPHDRSVPAQIVYGEPSIDAPEILCCTPSFTVLAMAKDVSSFPVTVSISLDGQNYCGRLTFEYYRSLILKSLSIHHGPNTGGTEMRICMSDGIPFHLPITVKFSSKTGHDFVTVPGALDAHEREHSNIICRTPAWPIVNELQLTRVQVSLNHGIDYIPSENEITNAMKFRVR